MPTEEVRITEEGESGYLYIQTFTRDDKGCITGRKYRSFSLHDAYEEIQNLTQEVAELKAHNERMTGDHK